MSDDIEFDEVCECEIDWRCPMHAGLPTPEDLLVTWWSEDRP